MDGGTEATKWLGSWSTGLSPRGRGNRNQNRTGLGVPGVYPRVDGGTDELDGLDASMTGLSPRGRGNRKYPRSYRRRERSIPAWTGEHGKVQELLPPIRSIPAWTGEPCNRGRCPRPPGVYPRVDGGTTGALPMAQTLWGLSPRGRGNQHLGNQAAVGVRSIPAWTGNQRLALGRTTGKRSIPAWTGEPGRCAHCNKVIGVYPRVDGGTTDGLTSLYVREGLSPRGRGNREGCGQLLECLRSIPAWTGEPRDSWTSLFNWTVYPRVDGGTG